MAVKAGHCSKDKDYLKAVQMWILRMVTMTTWTQWMSNLKVLNEVSESRKLIKIGEKESEVYQVIYSDTMNL